MVTRAVWGPLLAVSISSLRERIEKNIVVDDNGCWIWSLKKTSRYGHISVNNKTKLAHRVSYEEFVGDIPKGLQLDHLCKVTRCVNPRHLEPVTSKENLHRSSLKDRWAKARAKAYCLNGHEFTKGNTYLKRSREGSVFRNCRRCHADKELTRYYLAKKQLVGGRLVWL